MLEPPDFITWENVRSAVTDDGESLKNLKLEGVIQSDLSLRKLSPKREVKDSFNQG